MPATVAQMTPQELAQMIEAIVDKKLRELLADDDGELRPEVVQRLRHQLRAVENGDLGIPFHAILEQLNLN